MVIRIPLSPAQRARIADLALAVRNATALYEEALNILGLGVVDAEEAPRAVVTLEGKDMVVTLPDDAS